MLTMNEDTVIEGLDKGTTSCSSS